jgi:hypothetical protein
MTSCKLTETGLDEKADMKFLFKPSLAMHSRATGLTYIKGRDVNG